MLTQLLSSCRIAGLKQIAWVDANTLVATADNSLVWLRFQNSSVYEIQRSPHGGDWASLFSLDNHNQVVLHLRNGPYSYLLRLINSDGCVGPSCVVPLSWIHQVAVDPHGSFLSAFGSLLITDRAGYIQPTESCLIDIGSGDLQQLPYSAITIQEDMLYFVKDRTVYRRKLGFQRTAYTFDSTFTDDTLEVVASDKVLLMAPKDDLVWLATERGLFAADPMNVSLVHRWDNPISSVRVCGNMFVATGVGPVALLYDIRTHVTSCVMSSSKSQIVGFDILQSTQPGMSYAEGVLILVSEKGLIDCFSWYSSSSQLP